MARNKKTDAVEYEKRIRIVQEWIIDDWPYSDVVQQVMARYNVSDRQAKRYIKDARERWVADEKTQIEKLRAIRIMSLKKLKRSLQERYKGTPQGITAILTVERELIKLQGLEHPKKIEAEIKDVTDLAKLPVKFS